jgi:hypothetical protein
VALSAAAHAQRRIHMHIVARQIKRDEALEDNAESGERLRQEDEQTGSGAPIRDHVQHRTEFGGLLEATGCIAIKGIEKA